MPPNTIPIVTATIAVCAQLLPNKMMFKTRTIVQAIAAPRADAVTGWRSRQGNRRTPSRLTRWTILSDAPVRRNGDAAQWLSYVFSASALRRAWTLTTIPTSEIAKDATTRSSATFERVFTLDAWP